MIRIFEYGQASNEEIFARAQSSDNVESIVADIIGDVRANGDAALRKYCARFDGAAPEAFEVTPEEIHSAIAQVQGRFMDVMEQAAKNIRAFHSLQKRSGVIISEEEGITLGQKVTPIEKVGIYVPGGTAAYPSTVLMDTIPAVLAGCGEIVIATPAKEGVVNPVILAAAHIAGAHRVFKVGGAQAIAALAYGTESIPRVDKIVGPGNAFVAEAKKQVYGAVSIDMIAGPSDILVVADGGSSAAFVAADMLSQAEHDKLASAVLVTDSMPLALAVRAELERQLPLLPREAIARACIEGNSKIIVADSIEAAIDISNEIAPEHLELCVEQPFAYLYRIKNAGSVFLGRNCPEALGDYFAGPNHTLPTGGTARFSSPLSVDDFVKKTQFTYYTRAALERVSDSIVYFAGQEGLDAHAGSVRIRFEDKKQEAER